MTLALSKRVFLCSPKRGGVSWLNLRVVLCPLLLTQAAAPANWDMAHLAWPGLLNVSLMLSLVADNFSASLTMLEQSRASKMHSAALRCVLPWSSVAAYPLMDTVEKKYKSSFAFWCFVICVTVSIESWGLASSCSILCWRAVLGSCLFAASSVAILFVRFAISCWDCCLYSSCCWFCLCRASAVVVEAVSNLELKSALMDVISSVCFCTSCLVEVSCSRTAVIFARFSRASLVFLDTLADIAASASVDVSFWALPCWMGVEVAICCSAEALWVGWCWEGGVGFSTSPAWSHSRAGVLGDGKGLALSIMSWIFLSIFFDVRSSVTRLIVTWGNVLSFALAAALVAISVRGVRGVEIASSSGVLFNEVWVVNESEKSGLCLWGGFCSSSSELGGVLERLWVSDVSMMASSSSVILLRGVIPCGGVIWLGGSFVLSTCSNPSLTLWPIPCFEVVVGARNCWMLLWGFCVFWDWFFFFDLAPVGFEEGSADAFEGREEGGVSESIRERRGRSRSLTQLIIYRRSRVDSLA